MSRRRALVDGRRRIKDWAPAFNWTVKRVEEIFLLDFGYLIDYGPTLAIQR